MSLYKDFTSEKLSRAQTQCISKFYMTNRYVIEFQKSLVTFFVYKLERDLRGWADLAV